MSTEDNSNAARIIREISRNLRERDPFVVVEVSGGVVQRVVAGNAAPMDVIVVDYDDLGADGDDANPCFIHAVENLVEQVAQS